MEASILLGILGAGYFLNKNTENNDDNDQLPSQGDGYTTDYFHESQQHEEHSKSLRDDFSNVKIPSSKE